MMLGRCETKEDIIDPAVGIELCVTQDPIQAGITTCYFPHKIAKTQERSVRSLVCLTTRLCLPHDLQSHCGVSFYQPIKQPPISWKINQGWRAVKL